MVKKVNNNILITGGCGFIGTSLINYFVKNTPSINIRALDNLSVGSKEDLAGVCDFTEILSSHVATEYPQFPNVELIIGDIRDYGVCLQSCQGTNVVIHLAANTGVTPSIENPRLDLESNVIGTFNLLEASRQNRINKFIFASSGAPLGEVEPPMHEEKAPKPVSPYGASKLAGEGYCSAYYRAFGLKTISLRFGNVYGPRSKNKNSVIAKFFRRALNGETLEIFGDGNQTRDFIYINDLIQAILLSIEADIGGEVFQIATFHETTINEVAVLIKNIVEKKMLKTININHGEPLTGDVRRNYSDISKARQTLGYSPEYNLSDGLIKTFEYFTKFI